MRLGQAISSILAEYGVEHVFGIPGVHTLELFRDIDRSGIDVIVPRHEQGAGFIADAYSRVTGRPGVCYLITGPGVTNAMTPIAQAWHDSIPMLVIASTVERAEFAAHRGTLHDTPDLAEVLRPFTLISETVGSVEQVVSLIDEAFGRWSSERPRPVYLGIPRDLLAEEVGELHRPGGAIAAPIAAAAGAASAIAARAVERLAASARPVIVAGGGARHDAEAVRILAERIDAPVILTGNAKGLLPEAHPLSAGVSAFFPSAHRLLVDADLVLGLGTELSDSEGFAVSPPNPDPAKLIRVDIDAGSEPPGLPLPTVEMRVADFIELAIDSLPSEPMGRGANGGEHRAAAVRTELAEERAADPYGRWIEAVERAITDEVVLVADSAQVAYQSHGLLRLDTPGRWLAPYGFGTLGPALPMAIGAAVGSGSRPVVALAGDGGSLFTLAELATARDLGVPLTLVIWDNGGYREIETSFQREGIRPAGVQTSAQDLAAIAAGFGLASARLSTPEELEARLRAAIADRAPAVIVVDAPAGLRVGADAA